MSTDRCRTKVCFSLGLMLGLAVTSAGPALRAEANSIPGSNASLTLSLPFQTIRQVGEPGTTAPTFSHGYFIRFRRRSTSASDPKIYLYSGLGSLEHSVPIWPTGTVKLHLTSVDVGSELAFAGEALTADGVKHAFIGTSDLDGNGLRYFSTGTFLSTRIAIASDGTIWSVGIDSQSEIAGNQVRKDNYDMLHHYNSGGTLLDHFLPRWGANTAYVVYSTLVNNSGNRTLNAYDKEGHLVLTYSGFRGRYAGTMGANDNWLRPTTDGIVLYDGKSGVLYRYSASTRALTAKGVDIHNISRNTINGFALSGDGDIYISMRARDRAHPLNTDRFFRLAGVAASGLARWIPLHEDSASQPLFANKPALLGFDGNSVVYKSNGTRMNWSSVQSSIR